MEWIGFVFGSLMQLAILGLIVWLLVRAFGHRREPGDGGEGGVDQAVSVRRLFVYGLMLATLVLTAVGAAQVLEELTGAGSDRIEDDNAPLALGLSFLIVAGPAYGLLLHHGLRRLDEVDGEARSLSWIGYLNLALSVSLVGTIVSAQSALDGMIGVDDFELHRFAPVVVWGAVWAYHWFWLRPAHGLADDGVHLAAGSLAGLVTLVVGLAGLLHVAGDAIYRSVIERVPTGYDEPELASWIITASLGALVWSWYWLARYLRDERTPLWHTFVVLVGGLGGLVMAVVAGAITSYRVLEWFLGDPVATVPSLQFDSLPEVAAIFVVGVVAWQYHQFVLERGPQTARTEPLRAYDYLVSAAGLVSVVIGATLALVAFFEAITPEPAGETTEIADRLILGAVFATIGVPLWALFWSRIRGHAASDPAGELGSVVRRTALISLFGVGGLTVLVSAIVVLFVAIEDLLDGTFGGETVRTFRVALSLIISVTAVAWYHLRVFRSDREILAAITPVPSAAPPPAPPRERHLVVVGPRGAVLADELASATGARLDRWYRTDDGGVAEIDLTALVTEIEDSEADEMLVVVGPEGATIVPFES
jgi:hypothetical protein